MLFTHHAKVRVSERLGELVTLSEVEQAISRQYNPACEVQYITVKRFPRRVYLGNPSDPETPKGDMIVAKLIGDKVITVMLRKSTSQSAEYISH